MPPRAFGNALPAKVIAFRNLRRDRLALSRFPHDFGCAFGSHLRARSGFLCEAAQLFLPLYEQYSEACSRTLSPLAAMAAVSAMSLSKSAVLKGVFSPA